MIFTYKDRKNNNEIKETTITAENFIHRFLLHVLPERFVKIRYYGFLAHTNKKQSIPIIFKLINPDAKMPEKIKETICEMMLRITGTDITLCPECKKGKFITSSLLPAAWNTSYNYSGLKIGCWFKKGTPKVSQESCSLTAIIYRKRIEN